MRQEGGRRFTDVSRRGKGGKGAWKVLLALGLGWMKSLRITYHSLCFSLRSIFSFCNPHYLSPSFSSSCCLSTLILTHLSPPSPPPLPPLSL